MYYIEAETVENVNTKEKSISVFYSLFMLVMKYKYSLLMKLKTIICKIFIEISKNVIIKIAIFMFIRTFFNREIEQTEGKYE